MAARGAGGAVGKDIMGEGERGLGDYGCGQPPLRTPPHLPPAASRSEDGNENSLGESQRRKLKVGPRSGVSESCLYPCVMRWSSQ